jgi:hypothetical protein
MKGGNNELSMTKMNLHFRDYISMATVNADCWVALKNMCDSYDQSFTYFSEKARKEELQDIQTGGKKSKKKNPFERRRMAIGWLRPLQGTSSNDFILLCQGATVTGKDEDQKVFLGPTSRGGENEKHTLIYLADMSKLRLVIHNAIKWLHTEGLGDPESKRNWILGDIERYGDKKTLNYFGRDAIKEFCNAWVHVKEFTAFDTMEKYKVLIPYKVQNHVKLILEGKHGLFIDGKEVIVKDDTVWNMEFTYDGERGAGLETLVKIGGSIFSEATGKMGSNALWIFDCRKGPKGHFWEEMEYKTIMGKISEWMGSIERWNGIFMLPAGEDADMVICFIGC